MISCERCGAAPEKQGFGESEEIDTESAMTVRLQELQTNFGFNTVLCIDCRKAWLRWINKLPLMRQYSEAGFKMEHWRLQHRRLGTGDLTQGLGLLQEINDLDDKLYDAAHFWVRAGV